MIIKSNGREISLIYYRNKLISKVYYGKRLVYEGIRSCFGGGGWLNLKPWLNNDGWKNNG